MKGDVYLKIRNYGPLTEGSCGLDGGFMRIPKYTVFIGDQGSGKRTAAKLYSSSAWLEKAFIRKTLDPSAFTGENLGTVLSNQNLPGEYLTPRH